MCIRDRLCQDMQCLIDIGLPVNVNRFEAVVSMIEQEIAFLKGARKNVRIVGKRSLADMVSDAEAELERLRAL